MGQPDSERSITEIPLWACEQHPRLLWSAMHDASEGTVCPPGCAGPGMPFGAEGRVTDQPTGGRDE